MLQDLKSQHPEVQELARRQFALLFRATRHQGAYPDQEPRPAQPQPQMSTDHPYLCPSQPHRNHDPHLHLHWDEKEAGRGVELAPEKGKQVEIVSLQTHETTAESH